jgi:hypothetical protein
MVEFETKINEKIEEKNKENLRKRSRNYYNKNQETIKEKRKLHYA